MVLSIQTSDLTSGRYDVMARSNRKSNVENRILSLTRTLTECPKQKRGVPNPHRNTKMEVKGSAMHALQYSYTVTVRNVNGVLYTHSRLCTAV
jgi:hypothetical protein